METVRILYEGELRTKAVHVRSGSELITDAPIDNKGKGENFSPTDLIATALGSCIFTIMGITAREHGFLINGSSCKITKIMADNPRKIGEIRIDFDFTVGHYSDREKKILENCVKTCPVALTLRESVIQNVRLVFKEK